MTSEATKPRGGVKEINALRRSLRNKNRDKNLLQIIRKSLRLQNSDSNKGPHNSEQTKTPKRPREEDVTSSQSSPSVKRARVGAFGREARIEYWSENGVWPTEAQEHSMDRIGGVHHRALPRKKSSASLHRKRSDTSLNTEPTPPHTASDQQPREQKSAPYRHPRYESHLRERGSFMRQHEDSITKDSKTLCQKLLRNSQSLPSHTLFDDDIFQDTLESVKDRNEARVIRDITQLIVPPAEILAIRGDKNLSALRETINAGWNNAIPFCGPRPQPDYGLGFKREAFTEEQLQKLAPWIGDEIKDCSYVAATYDMYLPFLTCEVKCRAGALDVADRQNAHSQTVALQALIELFRLVGREKELHREISGFSISHSDVDVRIWGHYAVIMDSATTFYRHPIGEFSIKNTELDGEKRWTAYTFVRNIYDIWLPKHFTRLCSVIDQLPCDLNFEVSSQPQHPEEQTSMHSGLSQTFEDQHVTDKETHPRSQPNIQQATPDATVQSKSNSTKRKR